ncbi:MAG: SusD/RagB family nutrient-binding outer membrane lipoprotein [Bacteroidota bacterium]
MPGFRTLLLLLALAVIAPSCNRFLDEARDNPNEPTVVTPEVLLPSILVNLAYTQQGEMSRITSLWVQHARGTARCYTMDIYLITSQDTDIWWRNLYQGALGNARRLIEFSEENGATQYAGIGKLLLAYTGMALTDMVGDAPFSQAGLGYGNLTPPYDRQAAIYTQVFSLIGEAKTAFAAAPAPISPNNDDLIFGGNATAWNRFAHFLEARAHLHLAKRDPAHYAQALAALDAGAFASSADDATLQWGTGATSAGPYNQYITARNDFIWEGRVFELMAGLADPRAGVYRDTSGIFGAELGEYFARPDASYFFGSYVEQKFIEAEAAFLTGDRARAATAYNAAVTAALARHNLDDPVYLAAQADFNATSIRLENIMNQKYIALYLDPESYSDWRRTGFPILQASANNVTNGVIPRRVPYPESERLYNPDNFRAVAITAPVWWDED